MGLRRTLNRSLLLPILSLAIVVAVSVFAFTYFTASKQLETRVQDLADSSAVLFEELLWQLDYETLQDFLDRYVSLGVVTAAAVSDIENTIVKSGEVQNGDSSFVYSIPLQRMRFGSMQTLGNLTLIRSREPVWEQVWRRTMTTGLIALLVALITSFVIQRMLSTRIIEPVLQISNGLESWEGDWEEFQLELDRRTLSQRYSRDELDQLVESIHVMRDHILGAERTIRVRDANLLNAARLAGIGYAAFELDSGRFVECDENFAGMIGVRAEDMLNFTVREDVIKARMHVDDVEEAIRVGKQLALGNPAESLFRIADSNGDYRWIRQKYDLSEQGSGKHRLVRTAAQDVTELNSLQTSLLQAQKVKAIGNLTGGVAHDFNNLLAVISGNLEMLESSLERSSLLKYVHTSLHAVQLGADLTQQLLAFARKQPLRPEVLDVARLLRKLRPLLRTTVGEMVDLEVVADGGLWKTEVDRAQLEAAILNLVINARDAMPDGGKLTIESGNTRLDANYAQRHEEVLPGQYVCIAITDTGHGMGSDTMQQALEPFFTTKDVGEGVGLGLPMAYGFAKQSGGHLKIYSEQQRGTTIKIYLPRVKPTMPVEKQQEVPSSIALFNGLHVFLVEDNDELRETYNQQLQRLGSVVFSAGDGIEALELLPSVPWVDLILCDVVLPNGMKGPEIVAELLQHYPQATVLHMSGYTENAIIHQGRLDEGVVMLQKPFTVSDLVTAFAEARNMKG